MTIDKLSNIYDTLGEIYFLYLVALDVQDVH